MSQPVVVVVLVETALTTLIELARRMVQIRQLHHLDLVRLVVRQRVVAVRGRVRGRAGRLGEGRSSALRAEGRSSSPVRGRASRPVRGPPPLPP